MKVGLFQLDGKIPNLALMRIATHHRVRGDEVELVQCRNVASVERCWWQDFHEVYASLIFERSMPLAKRLLEIYPHAIIGGTGWNVEKSLEEIGITTNEYDYSLYPDYRHSIGFTQRGCRLSCSFCVVKRKEGDVKEVATIWDIWRGEPHPRNLLLLDNDFFGQRSWPKRIEEIKAGGFKVSWNQGFNVRLIGDEEAAAIAGTRYYDDQFKDRRLYTAWDNQKDEQRLFRNLEALVRYGVRPDDIMVYMLVAYDHERKVGVPTLAPSDFYRHQRLREFGCRPYPMPFVRTEETRGFQRWIIGAYDKRIPWDAWVKANYRPEALT